MLHLIYIVAFTIIAFLAVSNLIRSLITVSMDSQRNYSNRGGSSPNRGINSLNIHPELLDERGRPINEPLLVMRSVSVEDARQKLDALYNSSPNKPQEKEE
ncbi:DUF2973 domain-containing protein [Aphanothece sacrum]|uniref:DUF2973 domain-containing protein n=1 Tax=Aphanothece sacrum FPU1 TaxID=1920663 RepID=A0A401IFC7_APHSA|nr:DUF2973 domain-containing protein [Aphanothece sacrum]GBF79983.1 hypothetical protein AsFPU1_1383 [Aphanothece sacrum FPU1]GBF83797.1 hypothetical protein AsFPU3_0841 [Aphanothece sacrum FPU3]